MSGPLVLWALLAGYALGFLVAWIIAFRVIAADELIGVASETSASGRLGAIVIAGLLGFVIAIFWPFVAVVLMIYRYAVAPAINRHTSHTDGAL